MADEYTRGILREWGLESLIPSFREADVDEATMTSLMLSDAKGFSPMIEALIPSLGKRIIFVHKLNTLGNASNILFLGSLPVDQPSTSELRSVASVSTASTVVLDQEHNNKKHNDNDSSLSQNHKILERQNAFVRKPAITLPSVELPSLPENLKKAWEKGILHKDRSMQLALIRVLGAHLQKTAGTKPSKTDYCNFSRRVTEKYTFLADDNSSLPYGTVKMQLQKYIRNQNHEQKKRLTGVAPRKRNKATVAKATSTSFVACHKGAESGSDQKAFLDELKKHGAKGGHQVKMLLKKTHVLRREFVVEAENCVPIMDKFPHLGNYEMLIYDFSLLMDLTNTSESFDKVYRKLQQMFMLDSDNFSKEVGAIRIFQRLLARLHPRLAAGVRPALDLIKVGQEFDLSVQVTQGPCVLVCHDDAAITDAFLLCEGRVACQANINTAYKVIMMLMAAYFAMDRSYPKSYQLFLWFLHSEILKLPVGSDLQRTVTFNRFMKDYAAML